ncbi:MAG: hypothetical protein J5J06_09395 [Phycisphaerae bacterium]|nr:hypothetical protein [Phycisphaerae bacterium]
MGVVLSLLSVGGVVIGAILVGHATEDTWELDNAAKIHTLAAEANRLDTTDQRAALSKYEELNRLVGKRQVHDPELKQVVETAKNRCGELESKLAAELAREREEARQREQSKRDKRRRDELEQQQKEEARQRELAQWQEQERREKEARDKPIDISDIGVKLVDTTPSLDLCTYSWKATVTNRTASPVSLSVILTLYDEEGYELESDYKFGVIIGGQKNEVVTGQGMTKLSTFNRAAKYGVSVR